MGPRRGIITLESKESYLQAEFESREQNGSLEERSEALDDDVRSGEGMADGDACKRRYHAIAPRPRLDADIDGTPERCVPVRPLDAYAARPFTAELDPDAHPQAMDVASRLPASIESEGGEVDVGTSRARARSPHELASIRGRRDGQTPGAAIELHEPTCSERSRRQAATIENETRDDVDVNRRRARNAFESCARQLATSSRRVDVHRFARLGRAAHRKVTRRLASNFRPRFLLDVERQDERRGFGETGAIRARHGSLARESASRVDAQDEPITRSAIRARDRRPRPERPVTAASADELHDTSLDLGGVRALGRRAPIEGEHGHGLRVRGVHLRLAERDESEHGEAEGRRGSPPRVVAPVLACEISQLAQSTAYGSSHDRRALLSLCHRLGGRRPGTSSSNVEEGTSGWRSRGSCDGRGTYRVFLAPLHSTFYIDSLNPMGIRSRMMAASGLMLGPALLPVLLGGAAISSTCNSACHSAYGEALSADASSADSPDVTTPEDGPSATDPCGHLAPPGRPDREDDGASLPAFTMALQNVVIGSNKAGELSGFDLDGTCTCDTRPDTAFDGGASCQGPRACDGHDGLDNAIGPIADTFNIYYSFDEHYNSILARGRGGLLFEVSDYNGGANDKSVRVAVYVSDGIPTPTCPGSVKDPSRDVYSPGWCGDDTWLIDARSVVSDDVPAAVLDGWVHDGELVARAAPETGIELGMFGPSYTSFTVAGKLVALGEDLAPRDPARTPTEREKRLYRLENAILAGRIAAKDLLSQLGQMNVTADGGPAQLLCEAASFATVKQYVCGAIDLPVSPAKDHDPSATCDALSVGYAITALPALKGAISSDTDDPSRCAANPDGTTDAGASYLCP